ncbi:hypothetical protein QQS21_010693 [Conoideocrella luteorostrata]|uniref:Uncharacterized protein n=1 Tax=Conoideocrella luteorostrata TaxID=1105319 RepID=A0AAJ0CEQ1_9HYPO|nr:hypothetical protein QQS21_010693 [Conoideocrella luteorostrata]
MDESAVPPPPPCKTGPVRSASSAYPSAGHNTPRVQSPVSEYHYGNRLSLSDLSKFGRVNDDLSNLRSSSPTSSETGDVGDTSNHELIADATAAITEWQDASQPLKRGTYHNYSLADSTELFPSDSLSQRDDVSLSPSSPPLITSDLLPTSQSTETTSALRNLDDQYDGALDSRRNGSPEVKRTIAPALDGASHSFHPSKRKASTFSLRSLTRSLAKRRRLTTIRQWAGSVYRNSARRIKEAYRKIKYRHQTPLEDVVGSGAGPGPGAFRGNEHPISSPNGKPEGSNRMFAFDRSRRSEDWWKDGVSRYRAPSGMFAK